MFSVFPVFIFRSVLLQPTPIHNLFRHIWHQINSEIGTAKCKPTRLPVKLRYLKMVSYNWTLEHRFLLSTRWLPGVVIMRSLYDIHKVNAYRGDHVSLAIHPSACFRSRTAGQIFRTVAIEPLRQVVGSFEFSGGSSCTGNSQESSKWTPKWKERNVCVISELRYELHLSVLVLFDLFILYKSSVWNQSLLMTSVSIVCLCCGCDDVIPADVGVLPVDLQSLE
jgi:hypothetical protein